MIGSFHAFLHTIRVHMGLSMARPMFRFIILLSPLVYATIAFFVYGTASPEKIVNYVVLGSGFMSLWSSIVYSSASDINRERFYGTLELIFVAPVSFSIVLIGKIVANTLLGFLSMIISYVYLIGLFQIESTIHHPFLFLGSLLFVLISLSVFSFSLALIFTLSRQAEALMNFIEYPIYLVCGFLFPIAVLPAWVTPISYLLPPTWAIELLRHTLDVQATLGSIAPFAFGLLALILLYAIIGFGCYQAVEKKARINGKLGVY
jgi:ABC-2 type transport system permease protein